MFCSRHLLFRFFLLSKKTPIRRFACCCLLSLLELYRSVLRYCQIHSIGSVIFSDTPKTPTESIARETRRRRSNISFQYDDFSASSIGEWKGVVACRWRLASTRTKIAMIRPLSASRKTKSKGIELPSSISRF